MVDKKGRSEEKTDWLGDKYIQHYDEHGNKVGQSEEKTDWLGDEYTQHYDQSHNKTGHSEEKTDWLGDKYVQHYNSSSSPNRKASPHTPPPTARTTVAAHSISSEPSGVILWLVLLCGLIAFFSP